MRGMAISSWRARSDSTSSVRRRRGGRHPVGAARRIAVSAVHRRDLVANRAVHVGLQPPGGLHDVGIGVEDAPVGVGVTLIPLLMNSLQQRSAIGRLAAMATPRRMTRDDRRAAFLDVAADDRRRRRRGRAQLRLPRRGGRGGQDPPLRILRLPGEILLTLFDRVIGGIDERSRRCCRATTRSRSWSAARWRSGSTLSRPRTARRGPPGARSVSGLADAIHRRDRASHKWWHDVVIDRLELSDPGRAPPRRHAQRDRHRHDRAVEQAPRLAAACSTPSS